MGVYMTHESEYDGDEVIESKDSNSNLGRTRGYRRRKNRIKAIRKRRIANTLYGTKFPWYNNLHQYEKNKIHCSCQMCTSKTNNRGRYGRPKNWKISDLKKIEDMKDQLREEHIG